MNGQIDINQTTAIICEKCGCNLFRPVVQLRKISKLLIGAPEDAIININLFACDKCGHINEEFLPKNPPEEPKSDIIV